MPPVMKDYESVPQKDTECNDTNTSDAGSDDSVVFDTDGRRRLRSRWLRMKDSFARLAVVETQNTSILVPWILTALLSLLVLYNIRNIISPIAPAFQQVTWSPLQHLLAYDMRVFKSGFGGDADHRYQGPPSPELDANWDNLYNFGSTKLTAYEAARLPNKTWPIVQEPGKYIAVIDVFHQLHCLNMIRKALHPEYYEPTHWSVSLDQDELFGPIHLDHCIDSIRQSVMCMSDVSVIPWQWDIYEHKSKPVGNVAHTCRNFEAIRDWADDRKLTTEFDKWTDMRTDPLAGVFDWEGMGGPPSRKMV